MKQWRATLQTALVDRHGFDAAHVRMLVDETVTGGTTGSAANVKAVFSEIRKTAAKDDLVLLVLLGHGTFDGDVAKFNLVGPDLTATDWNQLLTGLPGRLIVVNTSEASFPFLEALKGKGRVVITATNSAAQKYATVFPEYFVKALSEASTDLDKNGRTSIFEVFEAASLAVKQHYEQRGQLTTERALLDDNGDGAGREEGADGPDGGFARLWNLDAEPAALDQQSRTGRAAGAAPHARGRGRGAEAAEGRDARAGVAGRLREADDRPGAGLTGDPEEELISGAPPLHALALRTAHQLHQADAGDEAHDVGPERHAARHLGPPAAAAIEPSPLRNWMKNQSPRKKMAGTSKSMIGNGNSVSTREWG